MKNRCRQLGMNIGTFNTVIVEKGNSILNEPSVITINENTRKVVSIGTQASRIQNNEVIRVISPIRFSVIADYQAGKKMIRGFLKEVKHKGDFLRKRRLIISVPTWVKTDSVEAKALRNAVKYSGYTLYLVHSPIAAALGLGIEIDSPKVSIIVDIGTLKTEFSVITSGKIVSYKHYRKAGEELTNDVIRSLREKVKGVTKATAENIKISIGTAMPSKEEKELYLLEGEDKETGNVIQVRISSDDIYNQMNITLNDIICFIRNRVNDLESQTLGGLSDAGFYLIGGGSLLNGFAERIIKETNIPFKHITDVSVFAKGADVIAQNFEKYKNLVF